MDREDSTGDVTPWWTEWGGRQAGTYPKVPTYLPHLLGTSVPSIFFGIRKVR